MQQIIITSIAVPNEIYQGHNIYVNIACKYVTNVQVMTVSQ